jgi:hypothetical protein
MGITMMGTCHQTRTLTTRTRQVFRVLARSRSPPTLHMDTPRNCLTRLRRPERTRCRGTTTARRNTLGKRSPRRRWLLHTLRRAL